MTRHTTNENIRDNTYDDQEIMKRVLLKQRRGHSPILMSKRPSTT